MALESYIAVSRLTYLRLLFIYILQMPLIVLFNLKTYSCPLGDLLHDGFSFLCFLILFIYLFLSHRFAAYGATKRSVVHLTKSLQVHAQLV